ncbi:MAG: 1-acyl-sn-glycerol-3-phosphate acyltransferase [Haliscomenobacter sp.]|nr:1-acyl-sn-glycerol-3-phosphate acyltransferase [Haliscomenobacter sp.]
MEEPKTRVYPHVIPNMEDWPIFHLSEDRRNFIQEIDRFTLDRLENSHSTAALSDIIAQTVYLERIRIREEPWKVDPPTDRQFWSRIRKRLVLSLDREDEAATKNNGELLKQIIHRYSEEIVGTFQIQTFLFARKFLTFFFNRLLQAKQRGFFRLAGGRRRLSEKLIVRGELEKTRSLATKGTVVIVPTHFSNLDSILIGYAIDMVAGLPSFSYGAGLNLYNTGYTAYFMNRLGAYRVDRRKKNEVYLETLKAMSNLSLQRGTNSLFFPGGTRSRSGMLETKVKLGLLSTAVEAQRSLLQKGQNRKIFIVPLVTSYHFVLEAQFLIEQYLRQIGKERFIKAQDDFFSPFRLFRFAWQVLAEGNDITFSFGQPMDVLGNPVDAEGNSFDSYGNRIELSEYFEWKGQVQEDLQRESEYTKMLGDKILERFRKDNIVLSSHLVAFAAFEILKKENTRLDLYGVLRLPPDDYVFSDDILSEVVGKLRDELVRMEKDQEIRLSEAIKGDLHELIRDGIGHLGTFHVKKPLKLNKEGKVISENFLLLYYYHNRLENYGLASKVSWNQPSIEITQGEFENV